MDLIILNDGLYQLIPVTTKILEGIELVNKVDCFDLCEIIRTEFTEYLDSPHNLHVMIDGSGNFYGCICR